MDEKTLNFFACFGVLAMALMVIGLVSIAAWLIVEYAISKAKKEASGKVIDLTGVRFDKKA